MMFRQVTFAFCLLMFWPALAQAVTVKEITSPSGIKAWLVEDHSIPIVSVMSAFAQGSVNDPPEQKGATLLLSGLVDEGAGGMSGEDFRTRIEDIGLRLSIDETPDTFEIGFSIPSVSLKEGTDLMATALSSLDFPQEAVERMRSQLLTFTEAKQRNPEAIAASAFLDMALPGHPYALDDDGLLEGVRRLTIEDLKAAHKRIFSQAGLHVAVVGDVTETEAGAMLDQLFSKLPKGEPLPLQSITTVVEGPRMQIIPFKHPQTLVMFGSQGIPDSDPASSAGQIAASILSATLHQVMREQRGLTYDVSFNILGREASSIALGKFSTRNQSADVALAAVKEAMALALAFTSDENVSATIRYFKGASALGPETNGALAAQLLDLQKLGFASNYLAKSEELLSEITTEDVKRAMARIVQPENLLIVAVGQPEGLTPK